MITRFIGAFLPVLIAGAAALAGEPAPAPAGQLYAAAAEVAAKTGGK